jgi:threonylcarbamoyladenosine tRNA methylthiotransferase MtaB
MKAFFYTLGCKLNQVETEALAFSFSENGIQTAKTERFADIIIINTCTVTSKSEQKARRILRQFLRRCPDALVVITGCYAQVEYDYLVKTFTVKDKVAVIRQEDKDLLLDLPPFLFKHPGFRKGRREEKLGLVREYLKEKESRARDAFSFHAPKYTFHRRAFLKIQDGCNGSCAYCRVPLARGTSISLDTMEIGKRVEELIAFGFREIVLTGVNISSYRHQDYDLAALMNLLLTSTQNVRFRLSSLEPEAVDERLCKAIDHDSVCPHFHLPVQSGSDRILKSMKRAATTKIIRRAVEYLREIKPDAFIAADVIAGFPGESDEDFALSYSFLQELPIHKLHVFPFSPRPGTIAAGMKPQVPSIKIKGRSLSLIKLSDRLLADYLLLWRGKEVEVILEKKSGSTTWQGSTAHSFKCEIKGLLPVKAKAGMLVKARVTEKGRGMTCRAEFTALDSSTPLFLPVIRL